MRTITHDKVSMEIFTDIYEFHASLSRPLNAVGRNDIEHEGVLKSEREKKRQDQFYMTKTYAEADRLMTCGYHEGYCAIEGVTAQPKGKSTQPRSECNVIGHTPHVAHYIQGHPLNMIRTIQHREAAREVTVWFDRVESCKVQADEMVRAARYFVDAVKHLEDHNVRVTINVSWNSGSYMQRVFVSMCLKKPSARINLMKMAYPMVHPSFSRRHCFKWFETSPIVTDGSMYMDYGHPLYIEYTSLDSRRKFMLDHGLIGKKDVLLDSSALRGCNNAKQVLDIINRQSNLFG